MKRLTGSWSIISLVFAGVTIGQTALTYAQSGAGATAQAPAVQQDKAAGGCCAKHKAEPAAAAAHEHGTEAPPAAAEAAALAVVHAWIDAIPKRDTARIREALADDFAAILPDGRRRTKAEHLKEVADGSYKAHSLTLDEARARVFGDVAIVTYYQAEESQVGDVNTSGTSAWTDVLVKRDGRWQIVAEHGSRFE